MPKCSGIALIGALAGALRPRQVVSGFDRCLFGGFDDFASIRADVRQAIYAKPDDVPSGGDFVHGHMAYSTLAASYPAAQFVTVLREPRARLLSHWVYWRAQPPADAAVWGSWTTRALAGQEGLAGFLARRDIAAQTDNLALRMLLWPHPRIPADDFIDPADDEALLSAALARLRRFAFADVMENPGLVDRLAEWCGAEIAYAPANETPAVPPALRLSLHKELTAEAYARLAACSRLDLFLWTVLAERSAGAEPATLCDLALARAIARCAGLLAG